MLPADLRRYGRQIRLSEIGERGQARLCAAEVSLGGAGFARTIEERYLRGAGLQVAATSTEARASDLVSLGLRHSAPSEIAEGALRALVAIRDVLGSEP